MVGFVSYLIFLRSASASSELSNAELKKKSVHEINRRSNWLNGHSVVTLIAVAVSWPLVGSAFCLNYTVLGRWDLHNGVCDVPNPRWACVRTRPEPSHHWRASSES